MVHPFQCGEVLEWAEEYGLEPTLDDAVLVLDFCADVFRKEECHG